MTNRPHFGRGLWVGIATSAAALLAGAGAAHAAGLSCSGLPAKGAVTSNPISCTVNCSAGGTLAAAVALKPRTTNRLTITIKGTCVASTDDLPGGITLQGATGATLQAPKATTDPVLGISGTGVILNNLTISGGVYALRGRSGSAFTGTDLVIEKASTADVLLNHSVATLTTSTVQNSANDGIDADWGSTVHLNGGTVQKNPAYGIDASRGASVDVYGGAVVQHNDWGAQAGDGATVFISDGTVENNSADGLLTGQGGHLRLIGSGVRVVSNGSSGILVQAGTVELDTHPLVADNTGNGITIVNGGSAKVRIGSVIEGNGANGIYVESGNLQLGDNNGPATIQSNKQNGIFMRTNSVAYFDNTGNQIVSNSGWGILCTGTPSNPLLYEQVGSVGTVSGNKVGQIACKVSP